MKTSNKLKIGLVFDDSLDRPDGVQQYLQRIAEWLTDNGHEVHFLVGETMRTDLHNVHSLSRNLRVTFNGNVMSVPLPTRTAELKQVFAQHTFDVLHVQMPYSPFMAGKLLKLAPSKTAVIGTFHILPYSRFVVFANQLLAFANRRSDKRLAAVMAASRPAQKFAKELYGYDCQVVPNPVRVADFTLPTQPASGQIPRIVFLGRLVERKGVRYLLEAVSYIIQHKLYDGKFEVIIAGKGELLDRLREYVRDANMKSVVSFAGFVPETDKAALLASADIAVFPSTSGESFGISLLEALAASRGVVLAGDNPGYRSVMHGFTEQLFDPRNTEVFAALLARWLSDTNGRKMVMQQQRKYVKQYDIAVVGAAVEKVYFDTLQLPYRS